MKPLNYRALPSECVPGCDCSETPNPACTPGTCGCAWCAECSLVEMDETPPWAVEELVGVSGEG